MALGISLWKVKHENQSSPAMMAKVSLLGQSLGSSLITEQFFFFNFSGVSNM